MNQAISIWNKFWFEEESPASICLFRILFGLIAIANGLVWLADFDAYFSPLGWLSIDSAMKILPGPRFSILFWLPHTEFSACVIFFCYLSAAILVTVGLKTRLSLVVLFITMVSLHFRNVTILNGSDTILRVVNFLLIFSPAGKMFSFDARKTPVSEQWKVKDFFWVQRLLQVEVAAIYFQTFLAKIMGEVWRNGTALYFVSKMESYQKFSVPNVFDHLWLCQLASWATLGIEFLLFTVVWIPKARYVVLFLGVLLHLSIDYCINIQFFEWVMIFLLINFVHADDLKKLFNVFTNRLTDE